MELKQRILTKIKSLNSSIELYNDVDITKLNEFKKAKLRLEDKFSKGVAPDIKDMQFIEDLNADENTSLRNRLTLESELDGLKQTMMLDLVEVTKKYIVTTTNSLVNPKGFHPDENVYIRPDVFFQFDQKPTAQQIPEGLPIDYSKLIVLNSEHIISRDKI